MNIINESNPSHKPTRRILFLRLSELSSFSLACVALSLLLFFTLLLKTLKLCSQFTTLSDPASIALFLYAFISFKLDQIYFLFCNFFFYRVRAQCFDSFFFSKLVRNPVHLVHFQVFDIRFSLNFCKFLFLVPDQRTGFI